MPGSVCVAMLRSNVLYVPVQGSAGKRGAVVRARVVRARVGLQGRVAVVWGYGSRKSCVYAVLLQPQARGLQRRTVSAGVIYWQQCVGCAQQRREALEPPSD